MMAVCKQCNVATVWCKAAAILWPKEQDLSTISQYHTAEHEKKFYISVFAKRITKFLLSTTTLTVMQYWQTQRHAHGFVLHRLINSALDFFHIQLCAKNTIESHYADFQICQLLQDYTTNWHQLNRGIAMVCYILPAATFKVILTGTRTMARGVSCSVGQQLPPLWCFMDDVMNLLLAAACMTRLLKRLKDPLTCARMKKQAYQVLQPPNPHG